MHSTASANPCTQHAQSLLKKAAAAGLTRSTATATRSVVLTSQGRWTQDSTAVRGCGTTEQESSVRNLLGSEVVVERMGPAEGDRCPRLSVWAVADAQELGIDWEGYDDRVYVLLFWAASCDPCQAPMAAFQHLVEQHPAWASHVRVTAVALDEDLESVSKHVQERGWTKVTNCWGGPEAFDSPAAVALQVEEVPLCLLVKKGMIVWRGDPTARDLELHIEYLLHHDSLQLVETTDVRAEETMQPYEPDELEQKLSLAEEACNQLKSEHKAEFSLLVSYILSSTVSEKHTTVSERVIASGSFHVKFREVVQRSLTRLQELFPRVEFHTRYSDSIPTISRGVQCSICTNTLAEADVQYLCVCCEPKHYRCHTCEDSVKPAHPHILYKITPRSSHFDELFYGKNLVLNGGIRSELLCENRLSPSACEGKIEGVRYKCAHCRDFDLCETCERRFWHTAPEEWKANVTAKGHREYHVLIKIPLSYVIFPRFQLSSN